jgi:hypothetical protein
VVSLPNSPQNEVIPQTCSTKIIELSALEETKLESNVEFKIKNKTN